MATLREVRLRIKSIRNISQVTRALQAVSTSRVRRATQLLEQTRPYTELAWKVLKHIANQPGRMSLHPLLAEREEIHQALIVMVSGDRGLAGAYNSNIIRYTLQIAQEYEKRDIPVSYVVVGRKGRDVLLRGRKSVVAEFSKLPAFPSFTDVSAIGRLVVDDFLSDNFDEVQLVYTDFKNMMTQIPTRKRILPLPVGEDEQVFELSNVHHLTHEQAAVYTYEPDEGGLLDQIIPRFTAIQIYQAILESLASEHAARMVAMKSATDNAVELANALQLQYNNARQQSITSEMIDIVGGAEALSQSVD
ncbi:MAG: ATP synthase F1 subunit gamma [Chloroflexota bacterium]